MQSIPFYSLAFQNQSVERKLGLAIPKISQSGQFILGPAVEDFEKKYAEYQRTKYCVGVGNGHDALLIALKALNIGRGHEVLVPSHTCQATWLAVRNAGATPVPVEVDPATYTLDVNRIESQVTTRTRAIIPVHLYGQPCAMDRIMDIARKHDLSVVEDNAQAHGARYHRKMTGSWGHCNATSFYPTKNLGAWGDGGAITTADGKLAAFARAFRHYGTTAKDVHAMHGVNSRLDELQAAILNIKLAKLENWNSMRVRHAANYMRQLQGVGDILLPPAPTPTCQPVFHLFVIQTSQRDKLKRHLARKGIETAIHYPRPIHRQEAYADLKLKMGSLPSAERLSNSVLSLPIWPGLAAADVTRVAKEIRNFFGH